MKNIEEKFRLLADKGEKALIPFFTIGFPSMGKSLELIQAAALAGSDIIEVGIPFSDPIADGPTIQFSSQESLKNGTTLPGALGSLERISDDIDVPLVVMSYYNPILAMGLGEFADRAGGVPISGVITPDLPPEEATGLEGVLKAKRIDSIYLVAPTSSRDRIAMVAERSSGFIYAVSVTGVTGSRRDLPPEIVSFLTETKKITDKPTHNICRTVDLIGHLANISQ